MHKKIKGLLSLVLVFAMAAASTAPVLADEQPETQLQSAEEQPETVEILETVEIVEIVEEIETAEAAEAIKIVETETELPEQAKQPAAVPMEILEAAETETVPVEQPAEAANVSETGSSTDLDYLYDNLTQEQKKFDVYTGTQPLSDILNDADILSKLSFTAEGVTPDSGNLNTQAEAIINAILGSREGDAKFYSWTEWNVWKVDAQGKPESIIASSAYLATAATTANFKQSVYLKNAGTGTSPAILCSKPILEPVWVCIDYKIPIYNAGGEDTGAKITVNAKNYGALSFPDGIAADAWKLVYDGTEYTLNTASEIWTNETNGIRAIGESFMVSKAKLVAEKEPEPTEPQPSEPESTEPTETEPQPSEPESSEQPSEPESTEPESSTPEPESTETQPQPSEPESTEPTTETQPESSAPEPSEPESTEPATETQPKPSEPESSQPEPSEPETTEPTETAPQPSEPESSEPESTEPAENKTDKTAPIISGVSDGAIYYGTQRVKVTDENLRTVTVNGKAVDIQNNEADITLQPSDEAYKIAAEDAAGNKIEYTIEIYEAWVRDGIASNGKKKLKRGILYKLGSGKWTISGDSTVYQGSGSFYVKNNGEYNFKRN